MAGAEFNGINVGWGRSRGRGQGRGQGQGGYRGRRKQPDTGSFEEVNADGQPRGRGADIYQDRSFSGLFSLSPSLKSGPVCTCSESSHNVVQEGNFLHLKRRV